NKSKVLVKDYKKDNLTRKILRSLPTGWDSKVTAIEESHNLSEMSLDQLVGNLLTHKIKLKEREDKGKETNHKAITLKARKGRYASSSSSKNNEDTSDDNCLKYIKSFIKSKDGQKLLKYTCKKTN
ncbi:hypothetical protein, partial [Paenibacillus apiarius]|uniref:hypothetical protein n=1 Tax=Paenibacillus apiarius TaxID=46240 RepID=UPI003B3AE58E